MSRHKIHLEAARAEDMESLAQLRVLAMRESLERVGRFDAVRARERFVENFVAADTRHIVMDAQRVGVLVLRDKQDLYALDHLYIHPASQRSGVGAAVLALVFAEADACGVPIKAGALRDSESNRFYVRHGFLLFEQAEWDNYYVRTPRN